MADLYIDEREAARRMVIEEKYQIPNSRGSEDFWLCTYCRDELHWDRETTYALWRKIFPTRVDIRSKDTTLITEDDYQHIFDTYWEKAHAVMPKVKEVALTENEFNWVNNLDEDLFFKQLVLITLWYTKLLRFNLGKNGNQIGLLVKPEIIKRLRIFCQSDRMKPDKIMIKLYKNGIIRDEVRRDFDKYTGEYDEDMLQYYNWPEEKGKVLLMSSYLPDIKLLFDDLHWTNVCTECGIEFEVSSSKKKTCLCPECYKKARVYKINHEYGKQSK